MRLFTAIDLPEEIIANLERLLNRLQPSARIKWSPRENLHITTKFIGEWPAERLEELKATLAGLPAYAPIPIEIRGLGFFPNPHNPRVFWAAVHAGPHLAALANATQDALATIGVEVEKRAFSPHLTLARIREPVPLQPLREAIAALPSTEFGRYTADRFLLYQSRLHPSGSVYTPIAEFPLEK